MIVMYSTHCPKCNVLEQKLNSKNINYGIIDDVNIIIDKGFDFLPVLEIDGKIMEFNEAVRWINEQRPCDE